MGMLEIDTLLETAITASLEAGEAIMQVYNTAFDVEFKDDKSPLTKADQEANAIINSHLLGTEIPIISEENKQINFNTRRGWNTCWIVDPVDGTKEFVKRNGEFTVNIALVVNEAPVLGVIYVPVTKELYYSQPDQKKAFKASLETHKSALDEVFRRSAELKPKSSSIGTTQVVGSRSHMNSETIVFVENLKKRGKHVEIVSKGSSLKFCLIAEGKADVYPRFAPTMEWDTAAGHAICNAVDVEVIARDTNKPLKYNKENLLNPYFLVSRKESLSEYVQE